MKQQSARICQYVHDSNGMRPGPKTELILTGLALLFLVVMLNVANFVDAVIREVKEETGSIFPNRNSVVSKLVR